MNKEIKTRITGKTLRKMATFQMVRLRRSNFIILSLALLVGVGTSIYAIITEQEKTIYIILLVLLPLMYSFLFIISPYLSASTVFKKLGVKKDENVFYAYNFKEQEVEVKLYFGEELKASNLINYSEMANVYEYSNFVFIVMKERYAFALEINEDNKHDVLEIKEYLINYLKNPQV